MRELSFPYTASEGSIPGLLSVLVGLKMCIARNAANMKVLHFGQTRKVNGNTVGEFALHVQCPWRIEHEGRILTGSADYYCRASDNRDDKWEPGNYRGHLQNEIIGRIMTLDPATKSYFNQGDAMVVTRAHCSDFGDIELDLSGEYRLRAFPSSSQAEEWRLIRPDDDKSQYVYYSGPIGPWDETG